MSHPFLRHDAPVGFAHRGGAEAYPENTERAFRHAVGLGYRYLETDAHSTSDGVVVAFHDRRLDRVTNMEGAIADLPWEIIQGAIVQGSEPVMTMAQLFEAFPSVHINIDPKDDSVVEPLAALLLEMNVIDRVCVTAFRRRRTARVKRLVGAGLCTGGGVASAVATILRGFGVPIRRPRYEVLQVPPRFGPLRVVTARFVKAAHRRGLAVHVWTIDDEAEMKALLALGVDGIMTDRPETLRQVLVERRQW